LNRATRNRRARRLFDALEERLARSATGPAAALTLAGMLGIARGTLSRRWPSAEEVGSIFGSGVFASRRIALRIAEREARSRLVVRRVAGRPIAPFAPLVSWRDPGATARLEAPAVLLTAHVGGLYLMSAAFNALPFQRTVLRWSTVHEPVGSERSALVHGGVAARTEALLRARAELRSGGLVSTTIEGAAGAMSAIPVLGRDLGVGAGAFRLARETGARIVPVAGLWRGRRVVCELGDPIETEEEAARWLEALLRREPGQIHLGLLRRLLFGPAVDTAEHQGVRG
jgi:hypothetical protein